VQKDSAKQAEPLHGTRKLKTCGGNLGSKVRFPISRRFDYDDAG
jgi:hypothetical protein